MNNNNLCLEAKISGRAFMNLTETMLERLQVSVGFSVLLPGVIEELV